MHALCRAGMQKLSSTLAMESKSYAKRATDLHRQVCSGKTPGNQCKQTPP